MIPRILVPKGIRPIGEDSAATKPHRVSSLLDQRIVVPLGLSSKPIDPKTSIPPHVPLDVLAARLLIPRDMPAKPLGEVPKIPEYVPLTILDSRTIVPAFVEAPTAEDIRSFEQPSALSSELLDVVEPDVITTGEVNLLLRRAEERPSTWRGVSRTASVVVHFGLIVFALFFSKLFPTRAPTQEQMDLARRQLSFVYLPPSVNDVPRIAPQPSPPSSHIRVDPRVLREMAPPVSVPPPLPAGPPKGAFEPAPELPSAPVPRQPAEPTQPTPRAPHLENVNPSAPKPGSLNLALPKVSPGRAIEQDLRGAIQGGSPNSGGFADPIPRVPGGTGGGGGGQGVLGGGVEILTPTEGVDFSNYLARLLAGVKRNWYAVIPESARMGEKGRVIIQFRITRDGTVPFPEPNLVRTSGKEPLDRAAMSAIRTSTPFEPLPPAFSGPFIELRFTFLYNLPIDYQ
jgi:TonB family protein